VSADADRQRAPQGFRSDATRRSAGDSPADGSDSAKAQDDVKTLQQLVDSRKFRAVVLQASRPNGRAAYAAAVANVHARSDGAPSSIQVAQASLRSNRHVLATQIEFNSRHARCCGGRRQKSKTGSIKPGSTWSCHAHRRAVDGVSPSGPAPGNTSRGTTIDGYLPLDDIWVTANFKETQFKNAHPQPSGIQVDAYGALIPHVDSIAEAGSRIQLAASRKCNGNYVKVVSGCCQAALIRPGSRCSSGPAFRCAKAM